MAMAGHAPGGALPLILLVVSCCGRVVSGASPAAAALRRVGSGSGGLCDQLLLPLGYPCTEHNVETKDGFLLSLQHIPHGKNKAADSTGPPVFLQHGLFQGGDTWFINSAEQSLGYILADNGFDVWIGNVRGTRWSKGHSTFSVHDKVNTLHWNEWRALGLRRSGDGDISSGKCSILLRIRGKWWQAQGVRQEAGAVKGKPHLCPARKLFWDWSWQELAEYDLLAMLGYVYTVTQSKILYVGHSQGTIMGLAALTMPEIVKMISSAALLCPISYLDHVSASFVLRAVAMHLDQMLVTMGIHQLNFRSVRCILVRTIDLSEVIRKGTFAKYDYGLLGNLRRYGHLRPPAFDLSSIPESLPIWMGYGGLDALADVTDVQRTIRELGSTPELLYIGDYGHIDFVMSVKAKDDVYVDLIRFLRENGWHNSY
uniref:Lipase n=1 Tax=Oryza meridionalis TaxID=40149 RepID=A0A0E0EPA7_9ORYZ